MYIYSCQYVMNASGVCDNKYWFFNICWGNSVTYDHFSGKFDCEIAVKITVPCEKQWMDSYAFVSLEVE